MRMRTEQSVKSGLLPKLELHSRRDETIPAELGVFPKPTPDQLEELLEERIISDRRKKNNERSAVVERRINQRRQAD